MRKLEKRAILCLLLAAALVLGTLLFAVRLAVEGGNWASYYANRHVYKDGVLAVGEVYDRNDVLLLKNDQEGQKYNQDAALRRANLHVTGDKASNIVTGANVAFRQKMIGYNFVTGTNGLLFGAGRKVKLTVDAELNRTAQAALAGRNGLVGVYNWKTGEILCMTSAPTLDPLDEAAIANPPSGTYLNKLLSATLTPGSIFKLVTTAAVIENLPEWENWSYTCTGREVMSGSAITCSRAHGKQDVYSALAHSCNCAYSQLTLAVGEDVMRETVNKLGLTDSYVINGIKTAAGSFDFGGAALNTAWAGIGQYEDKLNPLSMMVYVGAIAGGGTAKAPILLQGSRSGNVSLLDETTASTLKGMMRNNVKTEYGEANFPGLSLCAKTGTAEVGSGRAPHAWFCGFSGDYAFIVCVENGGAGISAAAPVANQVLQALVRTEEYRDEREPVQGKAREP